MSRLFYHVMQDSVGNLLFDVTGTMRIAGSGTLATIYGDEAATVILPNPMTNHPSFASFKCFLPAGDYDFYMAKGGYTFETLTGVQGHGTMAQQNANAVEITGGNVNGQGTVSSLLGIFDTVAVQANPGGANALTVATGAVVVHRLGVNITAAGESPGVVRINGQIGLNGPTIGAVRQAIYYDKNSEFGMQVKPSGADVGAGYAIGFQNVAGTQVGLINTSATTTSYATTSDARLKHDVDDLTGALAVIQALRPVAFKWNADDSEGHGLLAQEVAEVVQGVVTGEADAVDGEGQMVPQMIDYSKLVPWLIASVKELTQQVEMLTAKLAGT